MGVGLIGGLGAPWWLRLTLLLVLAGMWHCGCRWLTRAGVSQLAWDGDGRWWLGRPGSMQSVRLAGAPHRLGPWLWLAFRGESGRNLTVLDVRSAEPVGLCRLQSALKLDYRSELEVRDA